MREENFDCDRARFFFMAFDFELMYAYLLYESVHMKDIEAIDQYINCQYVYKSIFDVFKIT